MKTKAIFILLLVSVVLVSGCTSQPEQGSTDDNMDTTMPNQPIMDPGPNDAEMENPDTMMEKQTHTIEMTGSGFSPKTLTIKAGDTVTFDNSWSQSIWPASAMHPTHVVYDGTSLSEHCANPDENTFDACKGIEPGESWSFTFNKKGEWGFHDHLNPSNFGKITVE